MSSTTPLTPRVTAADKDDEAAAFRLAECLTCPLAQQPCFKRRSRDEVRLIADLRREVRRYEPGADIIAQGNSRAHLLTLLSGWAYRYSELPDGRRQILSFLLPGDFAGLQQQMGESADHGVQALTEVHACVFERDALWKLHREAPSLGFGATWLAVRGERAVDQNLISVGQRTAIEGIAALLLTLYERARATVLPDDRAIEALPGSAAAITAAYQEDGLIQIPEDVPNRGMEFPLTQQHIADAMGLSLVHTNRTLRALQRRGLIDWPAQGRLHLPDPAALAALAHLAWPLPVTQRPLI